VTFADPDHSLSEARFITVGASSDRRILLVAHTDRGAKVRIIKYESSTPAKRPWVKENTMKKKAERQKAETGLRREYDFSELKGGVRGKYAARYREGTNLVLLSPDVAEHFPNAQSVNNALRRLIRLAKTPSRHAR
jgi:hypothetical protein